MVCAVGGLRVDGRRNTHTHHRASRAYTITDFFFDSRGGHTQEYKNIVCALMLWWESILKQGRKMRIARTSQNRSHTPQQFAAGSLMLLLVSILLLCAIKIGKSIHQKLLLLHTHAHMHAGGGGKVSFGRTFQEPAGFSSAGRLVITLKTGEPCK